MPSSSEARLLPPVEDVMWRRSSRPLRGQLVRFYVGAALIGGAFFLTPNTPPFWALVCTGIVEIVLFPLVVDRFFLAPLERKVAGAGRSEAQNLLTTLRDRRVVQMFAPGAFLPLMEARLHLRRSDFRAAAKSFGEATRATKVTDPASLWSAEAQAHLLAGDRREAKALLDRIPQAAFGARERLARAVIRLSESGQNDDALADLEACRGELDDHARFHAARSLALQRAERPDEAHEVLLEAERRLEDDADTVADDLAKRARKGLRVWLRARDKRVAKSGRVDAEVVTAPASPARDDSPERATPSTDKKERRHGKKARKQARRDARKQAKSDERARKQAEREASEREAEKERRARLDAALSAFESNPEPAAAPAAARPTAPARLDPPAARPTSPAASRATPQPTSAVPQPAKVGGPTSPKVAPDPTAPVPSSSGVARPNPFAPPVVAPPSSGTPGRFAPPKLPPPPVVPPPPVITKPVAPPPVLTPPKVAPPSSNASDDGWGDALDLELPKSPKEG